MPKLAKSTIFGILYQHTNHSKEQNNLFLMQHYFLKLHYLKD